MSVKDSVLNFVIKAKNLAGDVVSKFRNDVESLDSTSAAASKSLESLGDAADNLSQDASSASAGTQTLNTTLDDVSTSAGDAAQSLEHANNSMDGIASAAQRVDESSASASGSINDLGEAAQDLSTSASSAGTGTKALNTAMADIDNKATDAGGAVDDLGGAAKDLGSNTKSAGAGAKVLGDAMGDVDSSASDAASSLTAADDSAAQVAQKLHDTGVAADSAASSVGKLGQRYDEAGNPIETARQEIAETNDELEGVSGASEKAGASIASFTTRLVGLVAAAFGINTVIDKIKEMLDTGDKFERLSMQMDQTMGSLAAGEQAAAWVTDFAKNTPLQMDQVTETFVRLKNFGLDPMDGAMQAIVDQAAKLGKGYEDVEGISLALGQAWAKQKLQGEEILQLIERGVPVWDLLAKTTGKSTAEIQKMSEAGLLGRDAIKAMIDEMGKQSAGAAAQSMTLMSGFVSNLKDEWSLFLNTVAKSGALDYAKTQLAALLAYIQELKATGQLKEYAQNLSDGFVAISEASKTVVLAIKDNIGTIALLAKAYAAVKIVGFINDAKNLGVALGTTLASGASAAANRANLLATALRAAPWLLAIDQAFKLAGAYTQLKTANAELAKSQAQNNKVQDEAAKKLAEFNAQTGLNVQSLDDIIAMQNAGSVAVDEYTGKWRLAANTLTDAEKAQRDNAKAMADAAAAAAAFEQQFTDLNAVLSASKKAGKDTADIIADIGEKALESGERGVEALSIAMGSLAQKGDMTKQQLTDGLAKFLASLSDEQYTKFGAGIEAALKRVGDGADQTGTRLSFMKTILEADLAAAAQRAGVEIGKVLTGVDDESKTAIGAFENLAAKVKDAGLEGEKANLVLKEGLLKTLKSMDTSKEIDVTIASIKELVKQGELTKAQGAEQIALAEKQRLIIKGLGGDQNNLSKENEKQAATWILIGDSTKKAAADMESTGGAVQWLTDQYSAIRAEVDALGPAATAAFNTLQNIRPNTAPLADEFSDLTQSIKDAAKEIDRLQNASMGADFTGINRYLRDTMVNAEKVKQEYAEQQLALARLQSAYANGALSARDFINAAQGAGTSTSLLNKSDLSALKNQIKAAQDQMDAFRDSTLGTLNSLQSELADLQGNAERVAQIAYETRVADLTEKLAEAKKTGDKDAITNAQESLRLAQEIYAIKKQQIVDDKAAQAQAKVEADAAAVEASKKPISETQSQPAAQETPQTGSVQRLEIALPSGKSANLSGSADDVNSLLDFLNEAGLRSLQ